MAAKLQRTKAADVVSQFVDCCQGYAAADVVQQYQRVTVVVSRQHLSLLKSHAVVNLHHQAVVAAEEAALEGCYKRWLVKYQAVVALLAKSLFLLLKYLLAVVKLRQPLLLIVVVTMLLLQLQVAVAKEVVCLVN